MRIGYLSIMAMAALVTFVAGTSAVTSAQPRRAASTAPLFPLSERDLTTTRQTGCECSFRAGRSTLMQMIGNEVTLRTRAGRQVCRINDTQFATLSEARSSPLACAGLRLSLRRTGRVTTNLESDSADGPASLTLGQGRTRRTLAGRWGCAC